MNQKQGLLHRMRFLQESMALVVLLATLWILVGSLPHDSAERKRYDHLRKEIEKHDELYFKHHKPEISDADYDALAAELHSIETKHPEWIDPHSPTRRVASDLNRTRQTGRHRAPMLSINKTDQISGVIRFLQKAEEAARKPLAFYIEEKIDGVAISLQYTNGKLFRALTRGDGQWGNDVTANVKKIKSVPLQLSSKTPAFFEVRGELFISRDNFLKMNQRQNDAGQRQFSNARNAAAGGLSIKNQKTFYGDLYDLVVYGIGGSSDTFAATQTELIDRLSHLGFPVNPRNVLRRLHQEVVSQIKKTEKHRALLAYDTDGVVIKINELPEQKTIGGSAKDQPGMIAYKWKEKSRTTTVLGIRFQVGRTGKLTPVADLEPVWLNGSRVSRVTLYNDEIIRTLGLRVGDLVEVEKAGSVIPKIKSVKHSPSSHRENPAVELHKCPACHAALSRRRNALWCPNQDCPGRLLSEIVYFASKNQMNIKGLGPSVVESLIRSRIIHNTADLYRLKESDFIRTGKSKKESANLTKNIQNSRNAPFDRKLSSLGMPNVSSGKAKNLATYFEDWETFETASLSELESVPKIGPKTARVILNFLSDLRNQERIAVLKDIAPQL